MSGTEQIPVQIAEALNAINAAITAERVANEERIAEIKKNGVIHPETQAKISKIEASIDTLRTQLEDRLKEIQRASIGSQQEAKDKEQLTANARLWYAARTGKAMSEIKDSDVDVERYRKYRDHFSAWIVRGDTLSMDIRNEMSVGSEADGGFWVPAEVLSRIQTRLFETSDIRAIATVLTTTTDRVELPLDVNDISTGGWVGEKASRTETSTPRLGMQTIETAEQYAEPHVTQRLLDDATRDPAAYLAVKIADKFARYENTAFVVGDGIKKPRGFLDYGSTAVTTADATRDWGLLQYVALGGTTGFPKVTTSSFADNPDTLINLISKLKPVYRRNARWLMNRTVEAIVRKLKDYDGRYMVGMGDIRDGTVGFNLLGFPIAIAQDMPDWSSGTFPIAFGDFAAAYTIVDRMGIRTLRDPYTSKPFIKFYSTKRVGGDVVDFDAIKLGKGSVS